MEVCSRVAYAPLPPLRPGPDQFNVHLAATALDATALHVPGAYAGPNRCCCPAKHGLVWVSAKGNTGREGMHRCH